MRRRLLGGAPAQPRLARLGVPAAARVVEVETAAAELVELAARLAPLLFSVAPEIFPYWDDFAKIDYHRASAAEGTVARLKMKYVNSQFQFYQTLTSAGSMLLLSQFGSDVTFLTSLKEDDEKSL